MKLTYQNFPYHLLMLLLISPSLVATELSIVTQNIMTESNNSCDVLRIKEMIKEFKQHKATIIALQEVVTPSQKNLLKELLPSYDFYFSDWKKVTYNNWKSYQPILTLTCLGGILAIGSITLYTQDFIGETEFYIFGSFAILLVSVSIVLHPHLFLHILGCFSPTGQTMANHQADHIGSTIAFAKKDFLHVKRYKAKPFDELAYQFPSWKILLSTRYGIASWWRTWIQVTWIRPGYVYCIGTHRQGYTIGMINMHLATGVKNTQRIKQIKEILSLVAHEKTPVDFFLLCGDMNANPHQPAVKLLKEHHWIDLWLQSSNTGNGYTWDISNRHTNVSFAPNSERVDYIWILLLGTKLSEAKAILIGKKNPYADHFGINATISIKKE